MGHKSEDGMDMHLRLQESPEAACSLWITWAMMASTPVARSRVLLPPMLAPISSSVPGRSLPDNLLGLRGIKHASALGCYRLIHGHNAQAKDTA